MLFSQKFYLYTKHIILRSLVKLNFLYLKDYRQLLFEELQIIKNQPGLNILEIGPKDGIDTKNLLKLKPSKLTLIDLPDKKKGINNWIKEIDSSRVSIYYENIMYEDAIVNESPYDIIWCTGVLYHNPEQLRFLKRLYKVLKPGGTLVIETATSRRIGLNNEIGAVEIWDDIDNKTKRKYHLSKNISHLPNKAAVNIWLKQVGFNKIMLSKCFKNNPMLKLKRVGFLATKPLNELPKKNRSYYNIANLNYEIGESK
tara:strand:- start:35 stop:802 length:768 start_codon:yes stop_codon:yes gene_type:complete